MSPKSFENVNAVIEELYTMGFVTGECLALWQKYLVTNNNFIKRK